MHRGSSTVKKNLFKYIRLKYCHELDFEVTLAFPSPCCFNGKDIYHCREISRSEEECDTNDDENNCNDFIQEIFRYMVCDELAKIDCCHGDDK